MITPDVFEKLWHKNDDYMYMEDFQEEAIEDDPRCVYAQYFEAWAGEHCLTVLRRPDIVAVNQSMLMLVKKYFEWRACVPKAHRDRIGERGHTCIFHVFEQTYQRLKIAELSLKPPMLFLPPPPPESAPIINLPSQLEKALEEWQLDEIVGKGV